MIMHNAHVSIGIHLSSHQQTARRVMREGFWWPTISCSAEEFVRHCAYCQNHKFVPYATLYLISPIPHWNSYIVKYLKEGHTNPKLHQHQKKAIEVEAGNYTLIGE